MQLYVELTKLQFVIFLSHQQNILDEQFVWKVHPFVPFQRWVFVQWKNSKLYHWLGIFHIQVKLLFRAFKKQKNIFRSDMVEFKIFEFREIFMACDSPSELYAELEPLWEKYLKRMKNSKTV